LSQSQFLQQLTISDLTMSMNEYTEVKKTAMDCIPTTTASIRLHEMLPFDTLSVGENTHTHTHQSHKTKMAITELLVSQSATTSSQCSEHSKTKLLKYI